MDESPSETTAAPAKPARARDLGIPLQGTPGAHNAITDVPGVTVGMVTLIEGHGDLVVGEGPVRTGVTAILPRGATGVGVPCAAGWFSLNGNGEMTGTTWIEEVGALDLPILLTNTHSVGACHTGVVQWVSDHYPELAAEWLLPVVAETWDGYLNDINGQHVTAEHAQQALDGATDGPVPEGSVGGGTGMNCHGFKGGSGTSSRVVSLAGSQYTVGSFVQANYGERAELTVAGARLGQQLVDDDPLADDGWLRRDGQRMAKPGAGSVIVIVATDVPLLPGQCKALARRVPLGLARTGTTGGHFSGDIFLAFSTANAGTLTSRMPANPEAPVQLESLTYLPWGQIDPVFTAVVQSVEEAVLNALVVNDEMVGRDGNRTPALPHDAVRQAFSDLTTVNSTTQSSSASSA